MLKDFKAFILRGNVVDLAIGVAIGAAFGSVVTAFTTGIVTPVLAIPGDTASFREKYIEIAGAHFLTGAVVDAIVTFVITAAALFFLVVMPVNKLMARRKTEPEVGATTRECPECLSSIPVGARRCMFCTSEVAA